MIVTPEFLIAPCALEPWSGPRALRARSGSAGLDAFGLPAVILDPDDVAQLTERFWRKDAARADMHHSGLGLALAGELACVLGMRLVPELDAARTFHMRLLL